MPIIIAEGTDAAGKSTFLNRVHNYLNGNRIPAAVIHGGGPPKTQMEVLSRVIQLRSINNHASGAEYYLLDRHTIISEQVYGRVLRGESRITLKNTIKELEDIECLVVFLIPKDQDKWIERFNESIEELKAHKSAEHIEKVRENAWALFAAYETLARTIQEHYMMTLILDPTDPNYIDEFCQFIHRGT